MWPAGALTLAYLVDRSGFGIAPLESAVTAAITAAVVAAAWRRRTRGAAVEVVLLITVVVVVAAYLLWLAWPALLPLGSGPDLTHHLQLVDYIERQGHLVHEPNAATDLGEMAAYTPGLHLLAIMAGAMARTDGFHAIYVVVALAVALKMGFFCLILVRLFAATLLRTTLAVLGVLLVGVTATYSLGSFTQDSFLAQVVSELFAIVLWWALLVWDQHPTRLTMAVFAFAGIAVFLTWPVWIGPPVVSLIILIASRHDVPSRVKLDHVLTALVPIAIVATIYAIGRTGWVAIVGTSGAVVQPSPAVLGWWLPLLSFGGLLIACADRRYRVVVVFAASIAVQAAALWLVARASGADTPYMAIKMTYLAIYPAIVTSVVAISWVGTVISNRAPFARAGRGIAVGAAWVAVIALGASVWRDIDAIPRVSPIVSDDLWHAGRWARSNVPPGCVDYLVGNEYTAYWLHLAVLGNPRASDRTRNDDTFLTQPSMARWLAAAGPKYAIANLSVLPAEIRGEVDVLQQFGPIAVIARRGQTKCP